MTSEECEIAFADYLCNLDEFRKGLEGVINDWKNSCEHYLTNKSMNRIAWLGQASVCYSMGIPYKFSAGWNLLTSEQQDEANLLALEYLNKWMLKNDREEITIDEALSIGRQVNSTNMATKVYQDRNVLEASKDRISKAFDTFEKLYISFSGGKDSSVMFHLVIDEAIKEIEKLEY